MASITINVPDAVMPRVVTALSTMGGWTEASGETRAVVAKRQIVSTIKQQVRTYESAQADAELDSIS